VRVGDHTQVANGTYLAAYVSEGNPANPERFIIFGNGIVSPRAFLFAKSEHCSADAGASATSTGCVLFFWPTRTVLLGAATRVLFETANGDKEWHRAILRPKQSQRHLSHILGTRKVAYTHSRQHTQS